MNSGLRVATPPSKPLLVFDGDCHFCTLWIRRWQQMTGDAVDYLPSQDAGVAAQFPEIPRAQFDTAVQFIATDGMVYSGADAVFRALACHPKRRWPLRAYQSSPAFAHVTLTETSAAPGARVSVGPWANIVSAWDNCGRTSRRSRPINSGNMKRS